jgi:hypothetical protein
VKLALWDKMKKNLIYILLIPFLLLISCAQSNKLVFGDDVWYPAHMLKAGATKAVAGRDENIDFSITIKTSKQIYIQGQKIDVMVTIQNKTGKTISAPGLFIAILTDIDSNKTIEGDGEAIYWGSHSVSIAPHGKYMFYSSPCDEASAFSPIKILTRVPWAVFYPGNFDFYIEYVYNKKIYTSNHVNFKILPVPDSLRTAFQDVMAPSQLVAGSQDVSYPGYLKALENNTGGFYERECLEKILSTSSYKYALWGDPKTEFLYSKAIELYEEFMSKYPDNRFSLSMWKFILVAQHYRNNVELLTKIFTGIFETSQRTNANINYQELYDVIQCYANTDDEFKSFLRRIGNEK